MSKRYLILVLSVFLCLPLPAQRLRMEVFRILDLSRPGMEKVKDLYGKKEYPGAAEALLEYYRGRIGKNAEVVDVNSAKSSLSDKVIADYAMEHSLYVHEAFLPPYNYGEDINWQYWPVQDNELRWQLHRHKWFTPMGRIYRRTGDERYAAEWMKQYFDWIVKNPMDGSENEKFAWRPLEVSHRLEDQINQFILFIHSPSMTPEFLSEFLSNYYLHAHYVLTHFSGGGNHLLFEAMRLFYAGAFFHEYRESAVWRNAGAGKLNEQREVQVYPDGCQYELCPHYHLACIDIFTRALEIARSCGYGDAFPPEFAATVERMVNFYSGICYPDLTNPCFSDAKITFAKEVLPKYRKWAEMFPDNGYVRYIATGGKEGSVPDYLNRAYPDGGFFVFRNAWDKSATQMVVKAGPPAFWHNQPDNGTFELWYKGRRLFADSGFYTYAGNAEIMEWRSWFRQTQVHNTVTLNGRNLETTDSKTLLWEPSGDVPVLVTENNGYAGFRHRRSVFFVDKSYFVILDEVFGKAIGTVELNYQLPHGKMDSSRDDMHFASLFEDGRNFVLRCFCPNSPLSLKKEKGWLSTGYHDKVDRMHISFIVKKTDSTPVRYITVIVPKETQGNDVNVDAKIKEKTPTSVSLQIKVGGEKKNIGYSL